MTQKELAEKLGITEQSVNKYEKGHRIPDADVLNRMVNILDCDDPGWLLTGRHQVARSGDSADFEQWPPEIKLACRQLSNIMRSNHRVIKPAILSNLAAFEHSVILEESKATEIQELKARVNHLEAMNKPLGCLTGTD